MGYRIQQESPSPRYVGRTSADAPFGTAVAYHFTGQAPDSMRADIDGNLYVAMYGQGRVIVFNRNGILLHKCYCREEMKATIFSPQVWF